MLPLPWRVTESNQGVGEYAQQSAGAFGAKQRMPPQSQYRGTVRSTWIYRTVKAEAAIMISFWNLHKRSLALKTYPVLIVLTCVKVAARLRDTRDAEVSDSIGLAAVSVRAGKGVFFPSEHHSSPLQWTCHPPREHHRQEYLFTLGTPSPSQPPMQREKALVHHRSFSACRSKFFFFYQLHVSGGIQLLND